MSRPERTRRIVAGLAALLAVAVAVVLIVVGLQPAPLPDAGGTATPGSLSAGDATHSPDDGRGPDAGRVTGSSRGYPPPPPPPAAPSDPGPVAPPGADPAEAEVLALVNQVRAANGCGALAWDEALANVARLHSADMAARDFVDHTNPDGLSPWDRAAAGGTSASAENIAAGQQTAAAVMDSWMNSAGHRANILDCANTRLGVGVGHGGSYGITWTQLFGR